MSFSRGRHLSPMQVVVVLTAIAVAGELAAQQKSPVPDKAAEQAAKKTAGEIYGGRFALAKTAADKTALAAEMIGAGLKVQDGSAGQYVLLTIARDIAAGAGDVTTALSAVKELTQRFDVPTTLPAETLLTAAEQASTTAQRKAAAEAAGLIIGELSEADDYESAFRVCEAARLAAQGAREFKLAGGFLSQLPELKRLQSEFQAYRDALAIMEGNPTDPKANLAAGRYLCFVKGDWEQGIPMLALGGDAALKAVALMDMRGGDSGEEHAAIGDAWWDLAEAREGEARDTLQLRAGFWYRQAEPKLAGNLVGLKAKQRLEEISNLGREIPAVSHRPAEVQAPPLAIAPFDERIAKQHQSAWAKHLGVPVQYTNSIGMRLALIPPGEFDMGSSAEDVARLMKEARAQKAPGWYLERLLSEAPKHRVRITRPYYAGICEVTQAEYERVMGTNPSSFKGNPIRPVEQVNWNEAVEFCRRLSEDPREKAAGAVYRLLTEAEWEYACRAGTTTRYSFGHNTGSLDGYAWSTSNSRGGTQAVGQLRPNAYGLFDTHGNVWEWCADWHGAGYYASSATEDPGGPDPGSLRVLRGASWNDSDPNYFRCAYRVGSRPEEKLRYRGFRVSATPTP